MYKLLFVMLQDIQKMFQDMKKAMNRDAACLKGRVRSAKLVSQDTELELESLQRDLAQGLLTSSVWTIS